MATTSSTRKTVTTGPNLNATVDTISDLGLRIKALEITYGLKGQLCWSMNLTHQVGGNAMIWNAGMTLIDGRDIVALKTGPNPVTLVNQIFREAARVLKAEYGPQAAAGGVRRTA